MMSLKFPLQSDDEITSYRDVLQHFQRAKTTSADTPILFDLSDVQFIKPPGLTLAACMIEQFQRENRQVRYRGPGSPEVERYLRDTGFYEVFGITGDRFGAMPRSTGLQLRRLERLDYGYLEQIPYWLARNSNLDRNVIRQLLQINLVEAIRNVIDHSRSDIGCYVAAQAFHQAMVPSLVFCVMDFGIGFRRSLQPVYREISDDVMALSYAVQIGVSSRKYAEHRPRGAGLDVIKGFMANMGRFEIVSGEGRWIQGRGGIVTTEVLPFAFPGSCLLLSFEIERLRDYYKEEAESEDEREEEDPWSWSQQQ